MSADSQENGAATNAIDGDASTFWHSAYSGSTASVLPHTFTVDMHATHSVTGYVYQPRPSVNANGRVGQYQIAVSADGSTWTTVASDTWADDATTKTVNFASTSGRYVRLTAKTEAGDRGPWSSAAEINLLGS